MAADYAEFGRIVELIIDQAVDLAAGRERFRVYRQHGIEPQTHPIKPPA